jgi:hypothetical protein
VSAYVSHVSRSVEIAHPSLTGKPYDNDNEDTYQPQHSPTVSYVLNPKKRAEILLSKGIFSLAGAENITREFEMQSALRPEAKTKLLHIPMSFHVRDRDLMERDGQTIVREWLRRMEACGFHFDQYIVVRHHDQDHKNPHFHLVINLTLADGRAVKTSYIGKYAKLASMEVTRNWAMVATDNRT